MKIRKQKGLDLLDALIQVQSGAPVGFNSMGKAVIKRCKCGRIYETRKGCSCCWFVQEQA